MTNLSTGRGKSVEWNNQEHKEAFMAAMKPRTSDGPMEAVREGRVIVVRVPLEGGGRLVVSVNDEEATELRDVLNGVVG